MKFCPNCGSKDIRLVAGGHFGLYQCKKCGYKGSVFPEKD